MDDLSFEVEPTDHDAIVARLREEVRKDPQRTSLLQELADACVAAGKPVEAAEVLGTMAETFARSGAAGKSIALLKKIQKLDPGRVKGVEERIAILSKERDQQIWMKAATQKRKRDLSSAAPEPMELELDADDLSLGKREERTRVQDSGLEGIAYELDTDTPGKPGDGDAGEAAERPDIGTSPLFSDFGTEELLAVMREMRLVTKEPGDIVVLEGEVGDSLFVLTTGSVKAFVKDKDGRGQLVRQMGDGAFFGEVSILTGVRRTATITAATDCELLELDRKSLDEITKTHPRVHKVLESFCAMRLNSAAEAQGRQAKKG